MSILLTLFVISSGAVVPEAQAMPDGAHHAGLALGVGSHQLRDRALSPTTYTDHGARLGLRWLLDTSLGRHRVDLRLTVLSGLHNRYDPVGISLGLYPALRYAWTHPLVGLPLGGRLDAGGGLGVDSRIYYLPLWDDSHVYWLTAYTLAALASARWPIAADHELRLRLRVPALAVVSRPEARRMHKVDDPDRLPGTVHRHARLAAPWTHREVELEASYGFPVVSWLWAGLEYRLAYVRNVIGYSAPVSFLEHELVVTAAYRL